RRIARRLAVLAGGAARASRTRGGAARRIRRRRLCLYAYLPAGDAGIRCAAREGAHRQQRRRRNAEFPRHAFRPRDAHREHTLGQYLQLEYFKSQQSAIEEFRRANPLAAAGIVFAIYVAVTGLSVPGAAVLSLAVGAIFGLLWGTLVVSFASSVGATLAFLSSRFLFRDLVRDRFGDRLR